MTESIRRFMPRQHTVPNGKREGPVNNGGSGAAGQGGAGDK
ncbi:hypothetical protein OEZ79_26670 [Leclercia adecarboxylata]|uniref:Uncharacterized protein n=1 Tax=Leclercia adecarboxylata TaxID=83655 RepID=A0A9X3YF40_9ENTR|nr:hypothetical protein [Leclercia adecarboxylata]MDC6641750.1 hypothetical protein [Leclercia adecarboxylata]